MPPASTPDGTQTTPRALTPERKTAIVVGGLFLVQTVSYLVGSALIDSAVGAPGNLSSMNETQVRIGVFLEFINCAAVVGVGALLFPILGKYRQGMALGYTGTKIIESALLLVSALFALLLLAVGQDFVEAGAANASQLQSSGTLAMQAYDLAFQLAMIALGAGSLLLCYILYEARLVPRALAVLGFVGYLALFASGWLEIAGYSASLLFIPIRAHLPAMADRERIQRARSHRWLCRREISSAEVAAFTGVGEAFLMVWLLARGRRIRLRDDSRATADRQSLANGERR